MFGFVFVNTRASPTDQLEQTHRFHWDPTDHISSCVASFFFFYNPHPLHTYTDSQTRTRWHDRLVITSTSLHVKVLGLAACQCLAERLSLPDRAPLKRLCHYPQIVEDEMKRMSKSEAQGL